VEVSRRHGAFAKVHGGHRVVAHDARSLRHTHGLRNLRPDRRRDRHKVASPKRVMHRHLPTLDRVLGVAEQLVGKVAQAVAAPEGHARLAIRRKHPVAVAQTVGHAKVRRLFTQ
jgi:hypothetical protein